MASRRIDLEYSDPLDLIWLGLAAELGLRVQRSHEVFASYDGEGTLTLCSSEHFDADDSLAQLIFHEVCHALVAGEAGLSQADWGLENSGPRDLIKEHACHRLQAQLSAEYGLRGFFAVTTDHREYWDALPREPLVSHTDEVEPALSLARIAYQRAQSGPWSAALARALASTQKLAELVRPLAPAGSLWRQTRPMHANGYAEHPDQSLSCGGCAWHQAQHCLRGRSPAHIRAEFQACEYFEATFDETECGACGACCHQGFHRVELRPGEPFERRHPELIEKDPHGAFVPRPGGHCVALSGGGGEPFRCLVYAERPEACADFELRGPACLEARRRVGRS